MDQMKYKNTTKWLFVFWLLSVVVGGILSRVYMNTPPLEIRPQILDPFSWFGIMITVYVLFVSFPLLYVIQRRAKLAGMKAVLVIARIFLVHHCLWIVGYILNISMRLFG